MSLTGSDQVGGQSGEADRRDHHRVADQLPLGHLAGQRLLEPVHLRPPGDGPVGVGLRRVDLRGELLVTVGAQVEHADLDEGAVLEAAVELAAVTQPRGAGHPRRHPLVVRLVAGGPAPEPVALGRRVVLGSALPGVVGGLVVVPGDDEGHLGVQALEVHVALVLRVPLAVVREGEDLVGGLVPPDVGVALAVAVLARTVLVDVVAHVQHRVQVGAVREVAVGAEPARLEVGARDHPESQVGRGRRRRRRGPGAAGGADVASPGEAVVVRAARQQAGHVDLDRVVTGAARGHPARADDAREAGAGRDLPADDRVGSGPGTGLARRRRGDARPDDHGGRQRVPGRDAVGEVHVGHASSNDAAAPPSWLSQDQLPLGAGVHAEASAGGSPWSACPRPLRSRFSSRRASRRARPRSMPVTVSSRVISSWA